MAADQISAGRPLIEDPDFSTKVAEAEIGLTSLEVLSLRFLSDEAAGRAIGPEASMLKILGSELRQQLTELAIEALGYYSAPCDPDRQKNGWNEPPIGPDYAAAQMPEYMFSRAATIYGGSNEIQRGIIAKMVLGL